MKKEITSKYAPSAIGGYSPALRVGDFIYVSGQLPINVETNEFVEGGVKEQTQQVLQNIKMLLQEENVQMKHIVKTTIFLKNMTDFPIVNEVYSTFFTYPYPARSTVEVAQLPKGALVEIECFALDTTLYEQNHCDECGCGRCGEE